MVDPVLFGVGHGVDLLLMDLVREFRAAEGAERCRRVPNAEAEK